jgi:Fur family transcriptional regulator, ferric uptake regulator
MKKISKTTPLATPHLHHGSDCCADHSHRETLAEPAALGERKTKQRQAIIEVLKLAQGPLSVQEILESCSATLGIATVYRNIKLLTENRQVQTVSLPDGTQRYEICPGRHHHHFQCRICNKVLDLDGCFLGEAPLELPGGHRAESHEITFSGICAGCRKKSPI